MLMMWLRRFWVGQGMDWLRNAPWLTQNRLRVYPRIFLGCYAVMIIAWIGLSHGLIDRNGKPLGTDFIDVYAASTMALQGHSADIYDYDRHALAEQAAVHDANIPYFGWHYPPMFLLLALPLALLPYAYALILYMAATFAAAFVVLRRMAPANPESLWLIAAFPGVFITLGHGQNGFLTVALLGGALLLLDRRPLWAGVLIGLLTYKPQLGLAIPLALMISGRWRVFGAALVTALLFALLSLAVFGPEIWVAFHDSWALTRGYVLENGATGWEKLQSSFAAVRMLGGGVGLAYGVQALVTLASLIALGWLWRRHNGPLAKAALPVTALLATPYVLDYDLVLLAIPIAIMADEGLRGGFRPFEKTLLATVWVMPLYTRTIAYETWIPLGPLLLCLFLLLIIRRAAAVPP